MSEASTHDARIRVTSRETATLDQEMIGGERVLVVTPMVQGLQWCGAAAEDLTITEEIDATHRCFNIGATSAERLEARLRQFGPAKSPSGRFELGYTLTIQVLDYFDLHLDGRIEFNLDRLRLRLSMIEELDRPVVVYLSANHFNDSAHDLAVKLSSDDNNLMWLRSGPMVPDAYFEHKVYAWTFSNRDSEVTRLRRWGFREIGNQLRTLSPQAWDRVAGVSVLGEVHHLFPDFFGGMGYNNAFSITDYAPWSKDAFRDWLRTRFNAEVATLNAFLDGDYDSFDNVEPPSKNIRHETLVTFHDHLDPFAHGVAALHGWAYSDSGQPVTIDLYIDGQLIGSARADLNRPDVQEMLSLKTANVGWRWDWNFRDVRQGIYHLQAVARLEDGSVELLAEHDITVIDRTQGTPLRRSEGKVDGLEPGSLLLKGYMDAPSPLDSFVYNPLASLWLEFRNHQVSSYIDDFVEILVDSGITRDRIFSHQLLPNLNSSWNRDVMAVDDSLSSSACLPSVTLYGGAAYGQAFFDFKEERGWATYGVGELHPISATFASDDYVGMFDRHRREGARFVSPYFISITPPRLVGQNEHRRFCIEPDNARSGSGEYDAGIRSLMSNH